MSLVIYQKSPSALFHQWLNQAKALFTQNSLGLQIIEYNFFKRYALGTTIALIGAPCIGKSTLIKKIIKMRPDFIEETGENAVFSYGHTFIEENYKKWGISQENWHHLLWVMKWSTDKWLLFSAIYDTERAEALIDLSKHASEEDRKLAKETLLTLRFSFMRSLSLFATPREIDSLIKNVFDQALRGKNTIFKHFDEIDKNPYSKHFHKVFIYCPLSEYVDRIDESVRMLLATGSNSNEILIGMCPLLQYASLIRAKEKTDENSDVIDSISPILVLRSFKIHFNNCLSIFARYAREKIAEFKRLEWVQKRKVLKAFGFDERTPLGTVIEIVPRGHYDDVINTGGYDESVSIELRTTNLTKAILKNCHLQPQFEYLGSEMTYWEEDSKEY